MVFDLLTELDKARITSYRNSYASIYNGESPSPLDIILKPWAEAKSIYLESIFKDQLIVTRPIEFNEDIEEIQDHVEHLVYSDARAKRFLSAIEKVYQDRAYGSDWNSPYSQQNRFVNHILDCFCLASNKIDTRYFNGENSFELPIKDNVIKIQNGAKPMRIITKIANAYNIGLEPDEDKITDLEYFRRKHSLALNQKKLTGDLCLSIHPLDYMTMSDNYEGWGSCMSWAEDGEYKQGTVEMMNSPCVVVGYLSAGDEKFYWGSGSERHWNSKKWRSLFIVDKDFIINIRSYPYQNNNLVKAAIAELAKLSGWENTDSHEFTPGIKNIINNRKVNIRFSTGAMYNDFGSDHYICLNPNETNDIDIYPYRYSGETECMWCGDCYCWEDQGPESLWCPKCNPNFFCESCEERHYGNDYYVTADGYHLCEYCYDNYTIQDPIDNLTYYSSNTLEIKLSRSNFEAAFTGAHTINVYEDNIGSSKWEEMFPGLEKPRCQKEDVWYTRYYVYPKDCSEKGLEAFGISKDDVNDYLLYD